MVRRDGPRKACPRGTGESGQTILIVAVALVVLILAAGLAVDMGYLRYQKRLEQLAADSAAIAGATQIGACLGAPDCGVMVTEGQTNAFYNGFDPSKVDVEIKNPPVDGAHIGDANYVEAKITQNVSTFFMRALGASFLSYPVTAWAVAYPGPGPSCIYALNSVYFSGFATSLYATGCTLADGGDLTGDPTVNSYILHTLGSVYGGTYNPGPFSSNPPQPTPVLGAPAGNPLPYLSGSPPTVGAAPASCPPYNVCAGYYDNLPIMAAASSLVTLQPGNYVIGNGGLSISGTGDVQGTGVTFYMTGSGSISINNGANYSSCPDTSMLGAKVQLSAPTDTTNPNAGILFIQTGNQQANITLSNGDNCDNPTTTDGYGLLPGSYLWGVLYFPAAQLTLTGIGLDGDGECSTIPRVTIAIAYTLNPQGNVNFGVNDCASPPAPYTFNPPMPDPIKDGVLVE